MTYRTKALIGYTSGGVALACLIATAVITAVSTTMPQDATTLTFLAWWVLALFIGAALAGIPASIYWPTKFERQHAVRHAQSPVDATKALIRRITPTHRH